MKHKIVISSEETRRRALTVIQALPLEPTHELIIKEYKKDRSALQNSYYWLILTVIGNELGQSKEELAEHYKAKILTHIFERDDAEYAEMVESIREVWRKGMKKEATGLMKSIVALTSTTKATVPQMAEYITEICRDADSLGIRLPYNESE